MAAIAHRMHDTESQKSSQPQGISQGLDLIALSERSHVTYLFSLLVENSSL